MPILAIALLSLSLPQEALAQSLDVGNCVASTTSFDNTETVCVSGTTAGNQDSDPALVCVLPSTGGVADDDVTPDGCNEFPPESTFVDEPVWSPPTTPGSYIVVLFASDESVHHQTIAIIDSSNTAPTATAQSVSTAEDVALPITLSGTDPESDPLTFAVVSGPSNGTLSGVSPNLTYTPDPNFNGADSFTFTARDANLTSEAATISITVNAVDGYLSVVSLADVNGNNNTDPGVLLRVADTGKNKLYVMDGGSGDTITTVTYGLEPAKGATTVPDSNGDLIPEFATLVEGSLFARVKDVVSGTLLGQPTFDPNYAPLAFFSVGDAGGGAAADVAVVGRDLATGKVRAIVKDAVSGALISKINFTKEYVPFDAVAVANVGDSAAMEIAVLGINAGGKIQAQVRDALTGTKISQVVFSKAFTPLAFAAVPDANGDLTNLSVLGRNADGIVQAQTRRVSDGEKISNVRFSKSHDPKGFFSFADSNGSGGGEIGVVGINSTGQVRAQVKEIADGAKVKVISYSASYPPVDAIAINGVAGTGQNEIAVLGQDVSGEFQLQIKDLLTGNHVKKIPLP